MAEKTKYQSTIQVEGTETQSPREKKLRQLGVKSPRSQIITHPHETRLVKTEPHVELPVVPSGDTLPLNPIESPKKEFRPFTKHKFARPFKKGPYKKGPYQSKR